MDGLMVEINGRRLHTVPGGDSWWLTEMEGFFDSPGTRFDENLIPGGDGAFDPDEVLMEPRRPVLRGACEVSTPGWADTVARPWLASLARMDDVHFRAFVGDQWLSLRRAKVRGQVKVRDVDETFTEFEIPLWAADPVKYGPMRSLTVDPVQNPTGGLAFPVVEDSLNFQSGSAAAFPGVFRIANAGTAPFYPTLTVRGPVDSFTIASESYVIEYAAAVPYGAELLLSPYLGGQATLNGVNVSHNLVQADWAPVNGGEARGYLFTPVGALPGAQLVVEHPQGAWW